MANPNPASTSSGAPTPTAPAFKPQSASDQTLGSLRAELDAELGATRRARLLAEIAEIEERNGDDSAAVRDYFAAYESDPAFREPLEGIARLLQGRSHLRGVGARLFEALVESAVAPEERVRALLMQSAYLSDVTGDVAAAAAVAKEATLVQGAPAGEAARAWLELELLAGRTADSTAREQALAERSRFTSHPTWRALLLVDRARIAAQAGETEAALSLLEEARALDASGTWTAVNVLEQIVHDRPGIVGTAEARSRTDLYASALETTASLVQQALDDPARGDALGVPKWAQDSGRAVDGWLRAAEMRRLLGQQDAAGAALERALAATGRMTGDDGRLAQAAVARARIRWAEQTGDTALAAQIAAQQLTTEKDRALSAALAMRVAEHAASYGNINGSVEALSRAVDSDPACLPARALLLDVLADNGPAAAFASQLEGFAEHLETDEARVRAFLLAASVWAIRANDPPAAKAALARASALGAPPQTEARLARMLASLAADAAGYEDATRRLLSAGVGETEAVSLHAELIRLRVARGDGEGADAAVRDLGAAPGGTWLANVVDAFGARPQRLSDAPDESSTRARAAMEALSEGESDPDLARSLRLMAAMRAHALDDRNAAREQLRRITEAHPDDIAAAMYLADLERIAGDHAAAARTAAAVARATGDDEVAAAFHLEAAFQNWREGQRKLAIDEIEAAAARAPAAGNLVLGWAGWGAAPDSLDARRRAIQFAENAGGDGPQLALERFAVEIAAGDPDAAGTALGVADTSPVAALSLAAALGRIAWPGGGVPANAMADALSRVAACGPRALLLAAAERVRMAREAGDPEGIARAAQEWFEAGGGLAAALEWLAAAALLNDTRQEVRARLAAAEALEGDARESMLAGAALLQMRIELSAPAALLQGRSAAVRLANLELAPPGCDPRRRAAVLEEIDGVLGEDAALDAIALAGWSRLAASDIAGARTAFERVTAARPNDLAAWEGMRACAEQIGDSALRARASAELGARCLDPRRGAAFWEEAALLSLDLGNEQAADRALEASFARDPARAVAFDKLFRRTRERKENDKLLAIIARRLEITDEPNEILKLFWEQARVLREIGDYDGALRALEHVTILDPDHVGALALLGEINIRRSHFEEAAVALARLAMLDTAPPKNRVTAGVAAVDLYENKLRRSDRALEVLLSLHEAKLSTMPVRERLAKVAARTAAWSVATKTLEELMNERPERAGRMEAARLAIAIHRDRLGDARGAAAAVAKLIAEAPTDGEAIDLLLEIDQPADARRSLLESARIALVESVQQHVMDASAVRRLAHVAQALDDRTLEQAALGVLAALGEGDTESEREFAHLAARKPRIPQVRISDTALRSLLAPGDDGPLADLFVVLGPTLAEALGPNAHVCGVGRRDRIDPRSGLGLRNEIVAWAGALGIEEIELYVGGKDPLGVQGIAGDSPALAVGAGVNAPLSPLARARIARELLGIIRGTTIMRHRDEVTIAAIVAAACRAADVPFEHPPYAVLGEVDKLIGKSLARKTRKLLPALCASIANTMPDARAWSRRALASQDRIAAVASGDPSLVLTDALGVPLDRLAQAIVGNARATELLRFAVSPNYLEMRRALGLEGGA
ncbi:MAG TPA: tetratricopeptide repeat protein [Polyangiaceae bacterium]|nr:tetratricopeptide repeat protein [Polyangiaceae bacterium]